jgi:hypothetical protein
MEHIKHNFQPRVALDVARVNQRFDEQIIARAGNESRLQAVIMSVQAIIVEARKKDLFADKRYREALLNGIEKKLAEALKEEV